MSERIKIRRFQRRKFRVRRKIFGFPARPRLAVARSSKHIYAQLIDDTSGKTLAFASSLDPKIRNSKAPKTERAKQTGALIAERAKAVGIHAACFDRGGRAYAGRIKALAEAARAGGLEF